MNRRLGKLPPRIDSRTLKLAKYLDLTRLPPALPAVNWAKSIHSWPLLANDRVGDCTCVGAANLIHSWTFALDPHKPVILSEAAVLGEYSRLTGYDPRDPDSDRGGVELDILNAWRRTEFAGHALYAYAAVNPLHHAHVCAAIQLFGGIYAGLALPLSAQDQETWTVTDSPDGEAGSWGGHCVAILGYDSHGLTCTTWGSVKRMSWGFADAYLDECYALISPDFMNKMGMAPSGFAIDQLRADLRAVTT